MTGFFVLKFVHVLSAMVWFGTGWLIPSEIMRSVETAADAEALVRRVRRAVPFIVGSGNLLLFSGVGLILLSSGFARAPLRILVGLGLMICLLVIGATVAGPRWRRIEAAIARGDLGAAKQLSLRFYWLNHSEHALGLVILALMIFKY